MNGDALRGRRVLVTRPAERAEGLVRAIEAAGGIPQRFPVIAIEPLTPRKRLASGGLEYAAVVFVSPAAALHGPAPLGLMPGLAPPLGAVGRATRAELEHQGFDVAVEPVASQDTEGLLRAPALQPERIAGRAVLIVRGEGGREDLAEGLMARGATVEYAEVYRRCRPTGLDPASVDGCEIVTATSTEGLHNLLTLLDEGRRAWVRQCPLVVNSRRIAAAAAEHGFVQPARVAAEPGDAGLLEAIRAAAATLPEGPSESA